MTLEVKKISKMYDHELKHNRSQYEHVLVYQQHQAAYPHAVYVEKYDAAKKTVYCINSHGQKDQHPMVSTSSILHLYSVKCTAKDANQKCSSSSSVVTNTKGNNLQSTAGTSNTPSNTAVAGSSSSVLVDPTSSPRPTRVKDPKQQNEAQRISAWTEKDNPTLAELNSAIQLAKDGHLHSMRSLVLKYLNISDMSIDDLKLVAGMVTESVVLWNITHTNQLSDILGSVKCQTVIVKKIALTAQETKDLVSAMKNCVEKIEFGWYVSLEIQEFCSYLDAESGKCQMIKLAGDTRTNYGDNIKIAAEGVGWTVTKDKNGILILERKK